MVDHHFPAADRAFLDDLVNESNPTGAKKLKRKHSPTRSRRTSAKKTRTNKFFDDDNSDDDLDTDIDDVSDDSIEGTSGKIF